MKNPNMPILSKPTFISLVLAVAPTLPPKANRRRKKPRTYALFLWEKIKDGIGKFYMGAKSPRSWDTWERVARTTEAEQEERTDLLIKNMGLKKGTKWPTPEPVPVTFLSAWPNWFPTAKFLRWTFPPDARDRRAKMASKKVTNVEPVLGTIKNVKLPPGSIDCVLIVDAYHEFSHPREMAHSIFDALRDKGRLILIEYRMEDPSVPIKLLHKMTQKQAIKEISQVGFVWKKTLDVLPQQHFMIFEKPVAEKEPSK